MLVAAPWIMKGVLTAGRGRRRRLDLGLGIDRWQAVAGFRYTFAADILGRVEFPLREPTFLLLTALAGEPMHGYGLIAEVALLSDGRISLRPVTLTAPTATFLNT